MERRHVVDAATQVVERAYPALQAMSREDRVRFLARELSRRLATLDVPGRAEA